MSDFTKLNRFERVAKLNGASAKARAVWAMAHNAIDRRGRMELGGAEWKSVMCRRLGVDASERQWFHAALRELESRGLVSVEGDVFTLHGHAGGDRTPRTFTGPSTDLPPTSTGPSPDLPPTSTGPSPDLHPTYTQPTADLPSGTLENHSESAPRARVQNREEESRIDKIAGSRRRSKSDPISDERVDGLIGLYRELHGKDDRWSPEAKEGAHTRAAHILRALDGTSGDRLSADEIALAFRGNASNPWHKEKGKHEISYILRPNKVYEFITEGRKHDTGEPVASPIDMAKAEHLAATIAFKAASDALDRGSMADRPRLLSEEETARLRAVRAARLVRELEATR